MDYVSKNHSKFLLMCHLIFVCKYRKKLLVHCGTIIQELIIRISEKHSFKIVEMEMDEDVRQKVLPTTAN